MSSLVRRERENKQNKNSDIHKAVNQPLLY